MENYEQVRDAIADIWEKQKLVHMFVKPLPNDPQYVERHQEYLKLEQDLDDAVQHYFTLTGRGKLNGGYFHD